MEELAAHLGAQVVASSTVGDEMVLLATTGRPGPMWLAFTVGQRVPLAPPLGTVFLAWAGPDAVERVAGPARARAPPSTTSSACARRWRSSAAGATRSTSRPSPT